MLENRLTTIESDRTRLEQVTQERFHLKKYFIHCV